MNVCHLPRPWDWCLKLVTYRWPLLPLYQEQEFYTLTNRILAGMRELLKTQGFLITKLSSNFIYIFFLSYFASWIEQREQQSERAHLIVLFEKYVPRCVEQMKTSFKTATPVPEISLVQVHFRQAHRWSLICFCPHDLKNWTIIRHICSHSDALYFARLPFKTRKQFVWVHPWDLRELFHICLHLGFWRSPRPGSGMLFIHSGRKNVVLWFESLNYISVVPYAGLSFNKIF